MNQLIIDDRERAIIALAENRYDHVFIERLTTGDFLIGPRASSSGIAAGNFIPLVVVERKTWADLAASLKDGRIQNTDKLRAYRDATGARVAFLLEGAVPTNPEGTLIEGIPYRNLRAYLDHLLYTDQIIELHSKNPADSLRRLLELARNLEKFSPTDTAAAADGLAAAKAKIVLTDEQISDRLWATFDGISPTSARSFRSLSIAQLYRGEIAADQLAEIQTGSRRFGHARAAAILSSLEKEAALEKLLCAVPKIAAKKARLVLDCLVEPDSTTPIPIKALFAEWPAMRPRVEERIGRACTTSVEKAFCLS